MTGPTWTQDELKRLLVDACEEAIVTQRVAGIVSPEWVCGYRSAVGYIATMLCMCPPTQELRRRIVRER